jgi:hypothetical protein
MPPDELEAQPAGGPGIRPPAETPAASASAGTPALATGFRPGALWAWALGLALLAGGVAWVGEEASRSVVNPEPLNREPFPGEATRILLAEAHAKGGSMAYGLLGGLLGAALGAAGGLCRRSRGAAIGAAILGLALAASAGIAASLFATSTYDRKMDPQVDDLVLPLMVHGAIWTAIGAAAGLAFGVGYGKRRAFKTLIGGAMGAILATYTFDILGGLLFPLDRTAQPLGGVLRTRVIARVVLAVFVAAAVAIAAQDKPRNKR